MMVVYSKSITISTIQYYYILYIQYYYILYIQYYYMLYIQYYYTLYIQYYYILYIQYYYILYIQYYALYTILLTIFISFVGLSTITLDIKKCLCLMDLENYMTFITGCSLISLDLEVNGFLFLSVVRHQFVGCTYGYHNVIVGCSLIWDIPS